MHWTFLGAGNMASSLIGGLLSGGADAQSVHVFDVSHDQVVKATKRFGVQALSSIDAINTNDAIVIAVKPDKVREVCNTVAALSSNDPPALVISVAAGVTAEAMANWLPNGTPIVRTMPNTPALLGLGATALYANEACGQPQKDAALKLMQAAGVCIWVEHEAQLNAVTALSGSGPAYFFYLIEQMIESATALGLPYDSAKTLAVQTAIGAATMARDAGSTPAQLRQQVTSKGGTTHAAVSTFDQRNLPATVQAAMQAAHDRAVELGTEFGDP